MSVISIIHEGFVIDTLFCFQIYFLQKQGSSSCSKPRTIFWMAYLQKNDDRFSCEALKITG